MLAETVSTPGANKSTPAPKLENVALESVMLVAPMVMAVDALPGQNHSATPATPLQTNRPGDWVDASLFILSYMSKK